MLKAGYLLVFLMLLSSAARARVSVVEAGPGLTDKYITAVCKDDAGLLWIGTKQGICTYDGNHFEPVAGALQSGNAVSSLLYDSRSGRLWAGTDKGLFLIDCSRRHVAALRNKQAWSSSPVAALCALRDGSLYVAYKSGWLALIENAKQPDAIAHFPPRGGNAPFFTGSLLCRGGDTLELTPYSKGESYMLAPGSKSLSPIAADTARGAMYFKSSNGDALFTARFGGGLQMLDSRTRQPSQYGIAALLHAFDNVIAVQPASPETYFILCKPARLYSVNLSRRHVDTIASDVFTGRLATSLFLDEDIVWIGSNKGLIKVTLEQHHFRHLLSGTPPISIRSLAEDEQRNLFAGTYSGLFRLGDGEDIWKSWSGMLPYAMLNVPGPYLYFVGEQPALYRISKQSLEAETGFYETRDLPSDGLRQAYALARDAQGIVWIGTSYGLATYDPARNLLSAYHAEGLPANTEIRYIRARGDGHLLLCTRSGLYDFVPGKSVAWHIGTATRPALSSNNVNYADYDWEGRLWLCTDNGLNIISAKRDSVRVLRTEDGLSDNTTYQLMWQGHERAWISTFNGLSSYNSTSGTFYNYYVDDGLTNNEFNHNAFLRLASGEMLFGSINGINAFFPDSLRQTEKATRLFASTITKWDSRAGRIIHLFPADSGGTIRLGPFDHSLTFNLALTDYRNPESQIFLYRIKGLFEDWVPLNRQRSLRLDGLAAGHYVLEIEALDSRGRPAINTLRYHIGVGQPFYKSWWLYLLLFAIASGLLYAFFHLRLQNIKRVQHLREQIASDLHDEVGSLLTRITMTSDNLRYSTHSESDRSSKLQKIASLSRNAASSMSDILWAIDARNDYTGNLADRMREHAEEMLAPKELYPEFDFAVSQKMSISSLLRQQLYLIYKEAINNIVKHSHASFVRIVYHHNEQGFELCIVNDGYSPKEKPSAAGQGLGNMRMRAGKIHAKAEIGPRGNEFVICVSRR